MNQMPQKAWIASLAAVLVLVGGCGKPTSDDDGIQKKPYAEDFTSVGLVWVPGGQFTMGTDAGEKDEAPPHVVKLNGFWMGKYEVTNEEFEEFAKLSKYETIAERRPSFEEIFAQQMGRMTPEQLAAARAEFDKNPPEAGSIVFTPPNEDIPINILRQHNMFMRWWTYMPGANWRFPDGPKGLKAAEHPKLPVVQIAWHDAVAFCNWKTKVTGVVHRLPTEAEWEYAARGGLKEKEYIWGDEQRPEGEHMANIWQGRFPRDNTKADGFEGVAPVGKFPANGYGLHDMAGNVWEWCGDWYRPEYYSESPVSNPKGPPVEQSYDPNEPGSKKRVQRGGSFLCTDLYCGAFRPARRMKTTPDTGMSHAGFRIVVEAPAPKN